MPPLDDGFTKWMELSTTTLLVVRPEVCLLANVVLRSNCLQTTLFLARTKGHSPSYNNQATSRIYLSSRRTTTLAPRNGVAPELPSDKDTKSKGRIRNEEAHPEFAFWAQSQTTTGI